MGQSNGHGAVPVVTVPPLSARQRDQQRAEMVSQINAVILQVNTLTQAVREFHVRLDVYERKFNTYKAHQDASFAAFWGRLKWLFLGNPPLD